MTSDFDIGTTLLARTLEGLFDKCLYIYFICIHFFTIHV